MVIVRQAVASFEDVVAFYARWKPYAVDSLALVPGLPPEWHGLGWHIEQHGETATCALVLKD